jgi:hypothetical protein
MSVTVATKNVGDVRDKFCGECECVKTFEDRGEDYIKRSLGVDEWT